MIPRLVPGDPVAVYVDKFQTLARRGVAGQALYKTFAKAFGLNVPLWQQYWHYWDNIFHGNLGISIYAYPATVRSVILTAVPYTLALLVPAILLSYFLGNRVGAVAARRKVAGQHRPANRVHLPGLAVPVAGPGGGVLPRGCRLAGSRISGGYSESLVPGWSWSLCGSLAFHWFLPFLTVFLVSFGGWAIGMRNLVIYELETDYARYLRSLGATQRLVRRYAYRNAVLPQLSGLALSLGTVIGGNIVTEEVFQYPGLGHLIYPAVTDQDYFFLQGIFLFIIIGVLLANFLIDIVYVMVDPRTRLEHAGGRHELGR